MKRSLALFFTASLIGSISTQTHSFALTKVFTKAAVVAPITASPELVKKFNQLKFESRIGVALGFAMPFIFPLLMRAFKSQPSARVQAYSREICAQSGVNDAHICHTLFNFGGAQGIGFGVMGWNEDKAQELDQQLALPLERRNAFGKAAPAIIRHEAGHIKERHMLKMIWALGILEALAEVLLEKYVTQPTTELGYKKAWLAFNFCPLPVILALLPISRYFERRADRYAINHTQDPQELESIATWFEELAAKNKIERGKETALTHPPIFERVDAFRAAAQRLREQPQAPVEVGEANKSRK